MIDRSDLDDRIAKCNKILDQNPGSQIFAALADAHRKKGELDKAFRICQNGLKIHTNYGSAHMVMAKINMDKGLYDWAEVEVEKAIELDGTTRAAELLLSEIYIYKGEFNKACRLLEKLHRADPENDQIKKLLEIARKIPLNADHSGRVAVKPEPASAAHPAVASSSIQKTPQFSPPPPSAPAEALAQPDLDFKQMLRSLVGTPGVEGALLVNPDGLVIEAEWNVPGETDLVAALAAETAKYSTIQMRESGFGDLHSMMIETDGSLTYLAGACGRLLAVVCSETVNLGSLKLKLTSLLPRLSA
jgi:predicted regulator of Ras-like GTPase activity (Roadblock/LC7/MglB family)